MHNAHLPHYCSFVSILYRFAPRNPCGREHGVQRTFQMTPTWSKNLNEGLLWKRNK